MEPNDKVIDRIRKLLALGTNNPNEHEAAVAMKRAHRLLAEYNLTLEQMTEAERKAQDPYTKDQRKQPKFSGAACVRTIAKGIGELYFCKVWYSHDNSYGDTFTFVGRASNVAIAKDMVDFVVSSLRKDCARQGGNKIPGFATTFMHAASNRVFARCAELKKQAEAGMVQEEAGTKNLPALRNTYLAEQRGCEEYTEQLGVALRKSNSTYRGGQGYGAAEGYAAGRAAGDAVPLRPGVTRKPGQKAITRS